MFQPDVFSVDLDGLRRLASDPIIKRGIAYFDEHRVTGLDVSGNRLFAEVAGSQAGMPYWVEIEDRDGELFFDCSCPFDWEPVCKHGVAALLACNAQREPVGSHDAADEAVAERVKRARREVEVRQLGSSIFGAWSARTVSSTRPTATTWFVDLRSLDDRVNFCDCPDFATNMLGTCKHIEAVRHKASKLTPGAARDERLYVYESWDGADAPRVCLHSADTAIPSELQAFFNERAQLRAPIVETFQRVRRYAKQSGDLVIGEDAVRHIDKLNADSQRRERAQQIREDIDRASGVVDGIRARLYPYQVDGVAFLAAAGRALLADDMGLGKTLQAIAAAAYLTQRGDVRRTLVVSPASLKHQWRRELQKFTDFDVEVVQGRPETRRAQYQLRKPFTIVNYELVVRDWEVINLDLAPDLLVLDEAQRIKNWRTKTADAIKALHSRYAFVLTGTPLENRLEDLYSLMQVVDPAVLGPLWRYLLQFHVTDDRGKVVGYRNLSELRRRLAPVMLRRDRREVRNQLPDKVEVRLDVEMTSRQQALHDGAVQNAGSLAQIMRKRPLTPAEEKQLMAALQSARMAADGANLVDETVKGMPPKIEELRRLLEDLVVEGGRKMVVFSEWRRMAQQAVDVAEALGLEPVYLNGSVPTARRAELLERFEQDPAVRVFVSTDAGGVGLNLQSASVLVNLDIPWNPAVLEQRIARVHRLGQKESVQIIKLVSVNSYEEHVLGLVTNKQVLFDNVISEDATEDVVGVSKRTLEQLAESFDADEPENIGPESAQRIPDESSGDAPVKPAQSSNARLELDRRIDAALAHIEQSLPGRVRRVLATASGLVLIVDVVDDLVEALVEEASQITPFVALDERSARQLERLEASPLVGATVIEAQPSAPVDWVARRLEAADALSDTGMHTDAVRLAAEAIQSALSTRAQLPQPSQPPADSVVWLLTQVAPRLGASADLARVTRLFAVSAVTDDLPAPLAAELLSDARTVYGRLRDSAAQ